MSLPKLNDNLNIISSLPDKPTNSATELKEKFDTAGNIIKNFLNNIFIPKVEEGQVAITNDFSGGTTSALSAEMGKKLNLEKQNLIGYGTTVPQLKVGEIFIQIFEEE